MNEPNDSRTATAQQWRTYLVTAAATAFGTNLAWEMAQMRAYRELESQPWLATLAGCTLAALGDVLLTLIPYAVAALMSRNARWAWAGGAKTYIVLAALGFATAVIFEPIGLGSGRWSYNERMPIVPLVDVGAWPALQLTLLVPISFAVANRARISRQTRASP